MTAQQQQSRNTRVLLMTLGVIAGMLVLVATALLRLFSFAAPLQLLP